MEVVQSFRGVCEFWKGGGSGESGWFGGKRDQHFIKEIKLGYNKSSLVSLKLEELKFLKTELDQLFRLLYPNLSLNSIKKDLQLPSFKFSPAQLPYPHLL